MAEGMAKDTGQSCSRLVSSSVIVRLGQAEQGGPTMVTRQASTSQSGIMQAVD